MFTHSQLVEIAGRWALRRHGFIFSEFRTYSNEIPDVIGFRIDYTTLIECKVSRVDFKADSGKMTRRLPEQSMGNYRIYCAPAGLIKTDEVPEGWGLLEVTERGVARLVDDVYKYDNHDKYFHMIDQHGRFQEWRMMYSALRRLELRDSLKQIYDKL